MKCHYSLKMENVVLNFEKSKENTKRIDVLETGLEGYKIIIGK